MMDHFAKVGKKQVPIAVSRKQMKTVRLKVFPSGDIHLSVPVYTPDEWIVGFIQQKNEWISDKIKLFELTKAIEKEEHIRPGTSTRILGRQLFVQIEFASQKRIERCDGKLIIYSPRSDNQADVDRQFNNWWQRTSKEYFLSVIDSLYPIIQKHGVAKPELIVRKMTTLWGSCGRKNGRINVNFYLYKAPPPCVEYVILREMIHFLYPKHNKDFYEFLTIKMPDWQARKQFLDYETVYGV